MPSNTFLYNFFLQKENLKMAISADNWKQTKEE